MLPKPPRSNVLAVRLCAWLAAGALVACQRHEPAQAKAPRSAGIEARCLDAGASGPRDLDRSLQTAQAKVRKRPDDTTTWVAVGQTLVRRARTLARPELYAQADACAQAALARKPGDVGALELRALNALNEHRFAATRDAMRELLAQHPDHVVAWQLRSDAELELGELDAAIDSAQHMMDLKPNLPAYGRAAHLRWLQGDIPAAKRLYEQAIRAGRQLTDPEPRAWMITQAALLFWHTGDYAGADAGFDLALLQLPDYPAALEGKGRVALSRRDYHSAVTWLTRAQARSPLLETSWLLGDAHTLLGQHAEAERAYHRVLQDGRRDDPRTLAHFLATKNRDIPEAVRLARAELEQRRDAYTKDILAFALYRDGQLPEAKRFAEEVLATGTADARLLFHAGTILSASGDAQRGQALRERALHSNPIFDPLLVAALAPQLSARAD